ncbi:NfeD family protein [Phenylobacterium soli]|uniref:NfeD family protein n=1 Tax=Phenylobacterium soli TaxID=2170551 RepID=A0A328AHT7_9CAUL|nr:NfeD family protein [Phenylobacterium soli]RAK54209.1 NfeD family protein [Phenylobacterium soli]
MADIVAFSGSHAFWVWTGLAAVLLAAEMLTGSGWLLWPATSAGAVAVLSAATDVSATTAVLVFAALTIVTTVLARRYLPRSLRPHGHDINDNVARLIGHQGRAVGAFRDRTGRVFIDGKEWAAELADGEALADGARVEVVGVQGARLRVRGA